MLLNQLDQVPICTFFNAPKRSLLASSIAFFKKVVLYGQLAEMIGARVTLTNSDAHMETTGMTVHCTAGCIVDAKYDIPMKNRPRANCKRSGRAATISNTLHFARAG